MGISGFTPATPTATISYNLLGAQRDGSSTTLRTTQSVSGIFVTAATNSTQVAVTSKNDGVAVFAAPSLVMLVSLLAVLIL